MIVPLQVTDRSEITKWGDVFRILGIKRCWSFLCDAGVPTAMIESPENLIRAAHYFWQRNLQGDKKPDIHVGHPFRTQREIDDHLEAHRLGLLGLLSDTFAMIVNNYGEPATHELYEWAQRNFIDHAQVARWDMWRELLLRLSNISGTSYPLIPLVIAPDVLKRVKETVILYSPHLLWQGDQREIELMATAEEIPLSSFEHRMVTLEAIEPGDDSEIDVLLILELVLRRQYAYKVWIDITRWLKEPDLEALLRWGREQAAVMNKQVEWVTLPDQS